MHTRPRTGRNNRGMLNALLWGLLLLTACDTGSRHEAGTIPPPRDPHRPLLLEISANEGSGGDLLVLRGVNFAPVLEENRVDFVSSGGGTRLEGVVTSFESLGFAADGAENTVIEVLVPSQVRSGSLRLLAEHRRTGELVLAGSLGFSGAPVVMSTFLGINGDLGFFRAPNGNVFPDSVVLLGYNLNNITSATVTDSSGTAVTASVSSGAGNANVTLPAEMDALSLEYPSGLLLECLAGNSDVLQIDLLAAGGDVPLAANTIEMQISSDPSTGVGAVITGCAFPSGVRRGDVAIHFNLLREPAGVRWDVLPEYFSPTRGEFVPCTLRIPDFVTESEGVYRGESLFAGSTAQSSEFASLRGRGMSHRLVWASEIDLPGVQVTTRLRLQPTRPIPNTDAVCRNASWESAPLVIDNSKGATTIWSEEFSDARFLDNSNSNALWGPEALVGTLPPRATPPTGAGTVDVVMVSGGIYFIDTVSREIYDETDPDDPQVILSFSDNPGARINEVHLRSWTVEAGASVTIFGDDPLIVRASGTGDDDAVAISIASPIDAEGEPGTTGTPFSSGLAGAGAVGGSDGGVGAFMAVDPQLAEVVDFELATRGGASGGYPGQSISYLNTNTVTTHRPGAGGGGGHATRGERARTVTNAARYGVPGRGGPGRGDSRLIEVVAGSGGGGGGAMATRPSVNSTYQARCGGGGGGGGGAIVLVAAGSVYIDAEINVSGGAGGGSASGTNAQGGAGGGGSAGSIAIRATGDIELGSAALLLARGGAGAGSSNSFRSGRGSDGRIRLEANGDIIFDSGHCDDAVITAGVCPEPLLGVFSTATSIQSHARSRPYAVANAGVQGTRALFAEPRIESTLPAGTEVHLLISGAPESAETPGSPAEFAAGVDDLSLLDNAEFLRFDYYFFTPVGAEPAVIERVELTVDWSAR